MLLEHFTAEHRSLVFAYI